MIPFEALYRENFPFVWAAARRCAPAEAVDDVVQEVFVTAYRRLDDIRWEVSPRGWLYGVTRRVAFRHRRTAARASRRRAAMLARGPRSEQPHPRHDAARQLQTWLEALDDDQREVWELTELLGMSGPEIAAQLEIPLNTVYSRLRLARSHLRTLAGSEAVVEHGARITREEQAPDRRRAQATWAAIAPSLGSVWPVIAIKVVATAKSAWFPALVVGYAVALVSARPAPDVPTEPVPKEQPTAEAEPVAKEEQVVAKTEPRAAVQAAHEDAVPSTVEPTTPSPQPVEPVSGTPSSTTKATPDLAAELALLERAQRELAAGDPDAAARSLSEHARTFPDGQLGEARRATHVRVLCAQGKHEEAARATAAFRRDHPQSHLARSLPDSCAALVDGSDASRRRAG